MTGGIAGKVKRHKEPEGDNQRRGKGKQPGRKRGPVEGKICFHQKALTTD